MINKKNREKYCKILGVLIILFLMNLCVNSWISSGNRVFYTDDLRTVNDIHQRGVQIIFDNTYGKFRPITMGIMWFVLKVIGTNYEILDEILLLVNYCNAMLVFAVSYKLQKENEIRVFTSLISSVLFIVSRFAYYSISEFFGLMESSAIFFSILVLYNACRYMLDGEKKYLISMLMDFVVTILIHERYISLLVIILFAIWAIKENVWKKIIETCSIGIVLILYMLPNIVSGTKIQGTGGVTLEDSFSISGILKYIKSQILYIWGINDGPQYLNGIEWNNYVPIMKVFVIISIGVWLALALTTIINKRIRTDRQYQVISILSVLYIGCCILCSSVTIRVEMRWIYSSYTAFIILTAVWFSYIYNDVSYKKYIIEIMSYACIICILQFYARSFYDNIYYWNIKERALSLYNATVGVYGQEFSGTSTIIVDDKFGCNWGDDVWTDEYWREFFRPYIDTNNISIKLVDNLEMAKDIIENSNERWVVLLEEGDSKYCNVTEYFIY